MFPSRPVFPNTGKHACLSRARERTRRNCGPRNKKKVGGRFLDGTRWKMRITARDVALVPWAPLRRKRFVKAHACETPSMECTAGTARNYLSHRMGALTDTGGTRRADPRCCWSHLPRTGNKNLTKNEKSNKKGDGNSCEEDLVENNVLDLERYARRFLPHASFNL